MFQIDGIGLFIVRWPNVEREWVFIVAYGIAMPPVDINTRDVIWRRSNIVRRIG